MRSIRYSGFLFLCVSLLISQNCVEGFDKNFAFENEASKDGDLSIAKMQLPNSQEGLVFQLHTPIHIYGQVIEKFTVMKNGLLALDDDALKSLSTNYPEQTASSGQRLHDLNERFLSTFSSVNDGPSGMVTVREYNVTKPDKLGCINAIQLARVQRLISVGHPDENNFTATSLAAIFWENMTNSIYGDSKSNSYTLLILTDGSKSYAVLQYISIEWPEKDITVSSAKPPEAGIFMKHPNGFHLPRSGQSVEVFKWTDESNVAVPGEWIFPLHDTQTDTDAALHYFPSIAAEFTKQLKQTCHRGVDGTGVLKNAAIMGDGTEHLNDQPKSPEADVLTEVTAAWDTDRFPDGIDDYYDYDGLEDDWPPNTDSIWPADINDRADNNTEADLASVLPEFGPTVPIMPEVVEETEIPMGVYDGDEDRMNTEEPGIVPKTFIPQDAELGLVTQGSMESPSEASSGWEMRTDGLPEPRPFETPTEPYVAARSLEPRVSYDERCDAAAECKVTDSECFRVQGLACCVCRDGYYGSGNHKCYSQENDHNYAFKGTLKLKLIPTEAPKEIPVYLDIQVGKNPRSSSGLRSIDPHLHEFHSIRFLMPIFHLLDGLIATSCSSDPDVGRARTYNLFTLGSAFQEEFKLQFAVNIEGVGRMSVIARLRVETEYSSSYSRGTLDMEVTATEPFTLVTRSYTEGTYRNNDQGRNYYTSYHVDNYGRIIFSEQPTAFSAESRGTTMEEIAMDELVVRWSGTGEVSSPGADNPAAGCLLQSGSPVPKNQHFYLRMQERGYCGVDCSSPDGLCNLYCVDVTSVHAREPDACTCIHCQREGEICKPAGSSYSCDCAPGLLRMMDQTCQADASGSVFEPTTEQCGPVYCHQFARCIEPQQGFCQCMPGYRGDGVSRCDDDPCSRCQRNEVCVNDVCKPSGVDLCEGIQCGRQAVCRDGACICNPGYTGDPMVECLEERDLCAGVQCHAFGQCYENRCYCSHGYVGDGVNFCDPRTDDPCDNVRCAANAVCQGGICSCNPGYRGDGYHECRLAEDSCAQMRCHPNAYCEDGVCRCMEGYQGDGVYECQPRTVEDPCSKVQCHPDADCYQGQCICRPGYVGDGYRYCHYSGWGQCVDQNCHPYAHCVNDRCQCKPGFEGDGYSVCTPSSSIDPSQCENCRGIPLNELAQCINGRCVCAQGFIESRPGTCTECVPSDCHVNAACLPNAQYGGVYSCQCKSGYSGDGVKNCNPDRGVGPEPDPTCGGGCYVRNSECNRLTGRCECRHGYDGDGRISCTWNCQLCLPNAICDRENERCTCMEGYYGDGQTFCERITPQPEPVTVQITGQGDVIRVADLQKPLTLFCYVTTKDESITGQWTQPKGAQPAEVSMNRLPTGLEIQLRIAKPALTDAGRYYCRAKQAEAYIDVAIHETAMPYDIILTSDDGILKVRSSGQNSTIASLWNLAENNKYARVAMVTDCNRQSVIYTCDFGNTIRWGNAHHTQKELSTSKIYQSQLARFRNLAVDPPSGNIYAWDEAASEMIVLNPDKPHMKHTLSNIGSFKQGEPVRLAGMALHSSRGLLYWAAFTDGWMPNGTIQVASMAGENERQLLQLNGEPLALSLSPSYDDMDKSAGRLCWIQRSITNVFALATEMHCARLSEDGRSVIMQERLRQFNPTEEPSWGLVHHRGTVLWTDASKPVYYSANPARRVHVRLVCCSNRFQSIATLAVCNPGMSNACTYSNGRCRHFCLPGEGQHSRTCVCPDSQPGCHREM
ncbi:tenascin [Clonorchis sinensis]|uniref:Tenascin n=1 Tax=Clonorchis sinensis TaxID=79923 RepID=H2KPN1_CLOSI|nr:tenascin [Clonorchis sinensis]